MPHNCSSQDNKCRTFLVQWSKGVNGRICSPPNAGVKFGVDGVKSMALQIHWNNANRSVGLRGLLVSMVSIYRLIEFNVQEM